MYLKRSKSCKKGEGKLSSNLQRTDHKLAGGFNPGGKKGGRNVFAISDGKGKTIASAR